MSAFERSWNLLKERSADLDRAGRPPSRWEQRHAPPLDTDSPNADLAMHRAMLGSRRNRTYRMNRMNEFAERGITPTSSQHNLEQGRGTTYPDEPRTQMDTFRERYADATDEEGEPLDVSQMSGKDMLAYLDRMREQDME
jgi:hypothetical protein